MRVVRVDERGVEAPIRKVDVSAYTIPTETPESDGTLLWNSTTIVLVQVQAAGETGIGYTYADKSAGAFIQSKLADSVLGRDAFDIPGIWHDMQRRIRNQGREGIPAMAVSAVDNALWDLKARLLGVPLAKLFGKVHERVPIYGSGGFTSYSSQRLRKQLSGWVEQGIPRVKMKVGRYPDEDLKRVRQASRAIGGAELYVDANGAYSRKQALGFAERFAEFGVRWFEEPVSSDDLDGMRFLRDRGPAGMDVASGEYGFNPSYFHRMLDAGAVDILQADATRCGGLTGYLKAAGLCEARSMPFSAHCAPALHLHASCAIPNFHTIEYFFDHVRIESMLFEGAQEPEAGGYLRPDLSRPGMGLELKAVEARKYAA